MDEIRCEDPGSLRDERSESIGKPTALREVEEVAEDR